MHFNICSIIGIIDVIVAGDKKYQLPSTNKIPSERKLCDPLNGGTYIDIGGFEEEHGPPSVRGNDYAIVQ